MRRESTDALGASSDMERVFVYLMLPVIGLFGAYLGAGFLAGRIHCGAPTKPANMLATVSFLWTKDPAVFGATETGCTATAAGVTGWLIGVGVASLVLAVAGFMAWSKYQQSDKKFIKDLRQREGLARSAEIAKVVGKSAVTKRVAKVRPSIKKPKVTDGAMRLGKAEGVDVFASYEESVVLIGPPRSGKGVHLLLSLIHI